LKKTGFWSRRRKMKRRFLLGLIFLFFMAFPAFAGTFRDDFSSGRLFKWTLAPEELTRDWKIDNGELISGEAPPTRAGDPCSLAFLIIGEYNWQDYVIEADLLYPKPEKLPQGGWYFTSGVAMRVIPVRGYYFGIGIDGAESHIAVASRFRNRYSIEQSMGQKPFPFEYDKWYRLKMSAEGEHFECFIDNELFFKFDDSAIPGGKVGLSGVALVRIDNVLIKGTDVPDWESKVIFPQGKLAVTWGKVKTKFPREN
jgi:hypothetical protein